MINLTEPASWYRVVDPTEAPEQGDFLFSFPVINLQDVSEGNLDEASFQVEYYDLVILSHSCDLVNKKLLSVIACPVWTLTKMGEKDPFFARIDGKEALRRGHVVGYHLLDKCDIASFEHDYLVVDFRNTKHVPFGIFAKSMVKQGRRLRLLSPYKEHLSQAFARFFMRVGLPADIPAFKK